LVTIFEIKKRFSNIVAGRGDGGRLDPIHPPLSTLLPHQGPSEQGDPCQESIACNGILKSDY
jgi:hypothetical protein